MSIFSPSRFLPAIQGSLWRPENPNPFRCSIDETVAEIGQVVEGIGTAAEAWRLAGMYDVSMPITREVYRIIHEGEDPRIALQRLLSREQKAEHQAPLSDN